MSSLAEAESMTRMVETDHFTEPAMPRCYSREARSSLLELVFWTAIAVSAWLNPEQYAKVFLYFVMAILAVLVFVVVVLLRVLYDQRRARRTRAQKSSVVVPIRG
jgi:hypothetical protein